MNKVKLATVWLDGCAGCHMSLLDMDEAILAVAAKADLVYGPLVDAQEFPEGVDVTLVEGAVASQHDVKMIQTIRSRSAVVIALGDCAVTGNVPSLRNGVAVGKLLRTVYVDRAHTGDGLPTDGVPPLLPHARPVHEFVTVDYHLPGCPPSPQAILGVVGELLEGRTPKPAALRFG